MDRLCWESFCGQLVFWTTALFMRRSQSPFGRRCDEPRGRRPIDIAQEPHVRPRVPRLRATWTNWLLFLISAKGS